MSEDRQAQDKPQQPTPPPLSLHTLPLVKHETKQNQRAKTARGGVQSDILRIPANRRKRF